MTENPQETKDSVPLRQLAIIIPGTLLLAVTCCSGSFVLGKGSTSSAMLSWLLFVVGTVALIVFFAAVIYALLRILVG